MGCSGVRYFRVILFLAFTVGICLPGWAEDKEAKKADASGLIEIHIGDTDAKNYLGDGWSRRTHVKHRMVRWLTKMEGDVYIELDEAKDCKISVTAAPQYLHYRRQNIGLYVNKHLVAEWVFPNDPGYADFEAVIPAKVLKEGKNTLTFRAGYRRRIRPDPRELSIAVRRITLTPL